MKSKNFAVFSIFVVLLFVGTNAFAQTPCDTPGATPEITINSPIAGTYYVDYFPYPLNIGFSLLNQDGLVKLKTLDVQVNTVSILGGPIDNPFKEENVGGPPPTKVLQCTDEVGLTIISNCSVIDDYNASLVAPWNVPEPGTYMILVSVKSPPCVGEESVEVTYLQTIVTVEHPAPPAVANEYLKSSGIKGAVTGCVISYIANQHAWNSKYGPKGGPYDEDMIMDDVDLMLEECQ